jgi:hypothetical protein
LVGLAATAGGLLLSDVEDVGEQVISGTSSFSGGVAAAAMDDKTRLLLEVRCFM